MIKEFDIYCKYIAYARLYKTFRSMIDDSHVKRPGVNTLFITIHDAYDSEIKNLSLVTLNDKTTMDEIVDARERNTYMKNYCQHLFNARTEFSSAITKLNRPTLLTVLTELEHVIDRVKDELLKV